MFLKYIKNPILFFFYILKNNKILGGICFAALLVIIIAYSALSKQTDSNDEIFDKDLESSSESSAEFIIRTSRNLWNWFDFNQQDEILRLRGGGGSDDPPELTIADVRTNNESDKAGYTDGAGGNNESDKAGYTDGAGGKLISSESIDSQHVEYLINQLQSIQDKNNLVSAAGQSISPEDKILHENLKNKANEILRNFYHLPPGKLPSAIQQLMHAAGYASNSSQSDTEED